MIRVTVSTTTGDLELDAVPCVEGPGLCVHATPTFDGSHAGFSVTHIRSGVALLYKIPTQALAHEIAAEIGPPVDWTVPAAQLLEHPGAQQVGRLIEQKWPAYKGIRMHPSGADPRMQR